MSKEQKQENKKFYAIQQAEKTADITIFGDIAEYAWLDEDATPIGIKQEIEGLDVDCINVHINCYGGSVSAGWAIYSTLRQHKAKIRTYADGFVCSAALYPFLAGDERFANSVSAFYLHEVSTGAWGYAKDLRAAADEADKLTEIGINAFVERAGMDRETVEKLMERETWLAPEEALSYGIATEVISGEDKNASQSALKDIIQTMLFRCKEPPENIAVLNDFKPEQLEENKEEPEPAEQNKEPAENAEENKQPEQTLMQRLAGIFNA